MRIDHLKVEHLKKASSDKAGSAALPDENPSPSLFPGGKRSWSGAV
jgi:hypothetical protein